MQSRALKQKGCKKENFPTPSCCLTLPGIKKKLSLTLILSHTSRHQNEMVEGMNGNVKDEGGGGGGGGTTDDDNICRDFLRNVCRRGKRCKFRHPDDGEQGSQVVTQVKADLTFCHDYQNGHCTRPMCR